MKSLRKRAIAKSYGFKLKNKKGDNIVKTFNITSHYRGGISNKEFLSIIKLKAKMYKVH